MVDLWGVSFCISCIFEIVNIPFAKLNRTFTAKSAKMKLRLRMLNDGLYLSSFFAVVDTLRISWFSCTSCLIKFRNGFYLVSKFGSNIADQKVCTLDPALPQPLFHIARQTIEWMPLHSDCLLAWNLRKPHSKQGSTDRSSKAVRWFLLKRIAARL